MNDTLIGTTGGHGGHPFEAYAVPAGATIKEIRIAVGVYVDSLQIGYSADGTLQSLPRIGGTGGRVHTFILDDDEVVIGISGRSGNYVDSLRIHTNKRTSELFGGHGGSHEFQLLAPGGHAVGGFFGRADWYIDALGIIVRPVAAAPAVAPAVAATPAPAGKRKSKSVSVETAPAPAAPKRRTQAAAVETPVPAESPKAPRKGRKAAAPAAEEAPVTRAGGMVDISVPAPASERTPQPADLEKVEGIGPAIAKVLIAAGIYDLADLAATPAEHVRAILAAAGSRFRMADPTTWPEQAAYGARGDWEGMTALQATLKAGRVS